MIDSKIGIAATITGRVQGVSYRKNTRNKAQQLGLTGWVANHHDGSVRLEAFGSKSQLDQLIRWLHQGPILAKVESITTTPIPVAEYGQFLVRH